MNTILADFAQEEIGSKPLCIACDWDLCYLAGLTAAELSEALMRAQSGIEVRQHGKLSNVKYSRRRRATPSSFRY